VISCRNRFLLELLHHSHSCRFGTFLYNTEKERIGEKLSESTVRKGIPSLSYLH
jgi:hypothetical protein